MIDACNFQHPSEVEFGKAQRVNRVNTPQFRPQFHQCGTTAHLIIKTERNVRSPQIWQVLGPLMTGSCCFRDRNLSFSNQHHKWVASVVLNVAPASQIPGTQQSLRCGTLWRISVRKATNVGKNKSKSSPKLPEMGGINHQNMGGLSLFY